MRTLAVIVLGAVLSVCTLAAEQSKTPEGVSKARAAFREELTKAQTEFDKAIKKATDSHRQRMKELLDAQTKAGDLDGALAIRDELRALDAGGGGSSLDKRELEGAKGRWVTGTWIVRYHPNKVTRTYFIRA